MTKRHLSLVQPTDKARLSALCDLENHIREVDRAARIAFLMQMHDLENDDAEPLALFAVEQVERLASELRAAFYAAAELGKAVHS